MGAINASWVGPVSSTWSDPTAWSTNPVFPNIDQPDPGDLYNATIGASGSPYTVTLDTDVTISRLTINSNAATFVQNTNTLRLVDGGLNVSAGTYQMNGGTLLSDDPMNVASSFVWNGGAIGGFGAVNLSPTSVTSIGFSPRTLSTTLNNSGVVNHGGAQITLNNGTFNNLVGATMNISTSSPFTSGGGSNLFSNSGLINVLTPSVTTTSITVPFLDTGTIALSGGTLLLNNFGSTTFGAGANFTGSGTADLDGSTVTLAGTTTLNVANTQLNGGTINGSGDLQINDLFTWNSGTMSGTGVTHVAHNAEIDFSKSGAQRGLSRTINNDGVVNLANGQLVLTNGTFNNLADGVVFITGGIPFILNSSTTSLVNNAGLINVNASSFGFATLTSVTDSGTINVSGGTATFAGTFNYQTGATLIGSGTIDLDASGSQIVNGTLTLAGSNMRLDSGSVSGNGNIVLSGALTWNGGTLGDGGTVGLSGLSTLLIQSSGVLNVANTSGHTLGRNISNGGVINIQTSSISINNSVISNLAGATINITTSTSPFGFASNNATIRNSGVMNFDEQLGSGTGVSGTTLLNSGTINLLSGTLNLGGSSLENGQSLVNSGTINNFGGTLLLGQGTQMPGAFVGGAGYIDLCGPGQTIETLDGNLTASGSNLNLNAGTITGPGNLLIRGNFTWNGGTLVGSGIIDVNSTSTMNIGTLGQITRSLSRTINNSGVVNITQGSIALSNGVLNNLPGGTINLSGVNFSSVFTNFGSGTNNLINNAGQINVNVGTSNLTLFNSGTSSLFDTGTINVPAGTLILGGGTFDTGAVVTGAGYVNLGGVSNGTVTLNDALAVNGSNVNLTTGTLNGVGDLDINNVFNWGGGTITGTGAVNVAPGATLNITSLNFSHSLLRPLNNSGTVNIAGNSSFGFSGVVDNTPGGVFNVNAGIGTIFSLATSFQNDGLLNIAPSGGSMTYSFPLIDSGTINATGTVTLSSASLVFEAGSTLAGHGTIVFGSGSTTTITLNGASAWSTSAIQLNGGSLSGPGDLNLTSSLAWSNGTILGPGVINVATGATFNIIGSSHTLGRTVNNSGNLILSASPIILSGGTINNTATGVINAGSINTVTNIQPGGGVNRILNAGTFNVTSGPVNVNVPFSNTGTLVVGGGGNSATASFTDQISQIVGSTLLRGTYIVHDSSSLMLGLGSITNNAANVTLDGPGAQFPTINTIANNSGSFAVTGGQVFVTSASYTNTGTTVVGHGSTLHIVGTLNSTGTLNIQGSLIVDGASPAAILDQIISGRAGGAWNGAGINSSAAAANPNTALGFAPASSLGASAAVAFDSQPTDGSSIIVKYTELGDANLDGTVNALDFNALASHFGDPNAIWSDSDFNYDGTVDTQDFVALAGNFGGTMSSAPSPDLSLGALVPEPGAFGIVAGLVLLARRRKR
jgi:hypothetical protein